MRPWCAPRRAASGDARVWSSRLLMHLVVDCPIGLVNIRRPELNDPMTRFPLSLTDVHAEIVSCDRCPRLLDYCRRVGREKRRAFRDETYWARPVPGFGDPTARVLIVGLAPAAHGANRTGRVFTGDGAGGSGDFLMSA